MTLVIDKRVIAEAFSSLRNQKTHPLFAGYLHLQQRATELGSSIKITPDFVGFYKKYLLVQDHPLGYSYIRVFTDKKPTARNLWLNDNIAGSYAPSSLRPGQPFRQVVDIQDRLYTMKKDHSQKAYDFLLYGKRLNVFALAAFLYRDYGFSDDLSYEGLLATFAFEFGYSDQFDGAINSDFIQLFSTEIPDFMTGEWLENYDRK